MGCPLNNPELFNKLSPETSAAQLRFEEERLLPDACRDCISYAQSLPAEFHSDQAENLCTHNDNSDDDSYCDITLGVIPSTLHRYVEEESGLDYGCNADGCSGILGLVVTRFDCRQELQ